MWLLPVFSPACRVAAHVYYRLTIAGERVPLSGPVLLVANHPNSLLDPVLVAASARRPVRFLAKAPLFTDRKVGWLVRGSGAIPVYRRADDPTAMGQNTDMFRAVHGALGRGDAVGLFPEGLSHSDPSMAPLKTGAARIALGAASTSGAFPIIPVGLVFQRKHVFRSAAHVVVGAPVEWDDLAGRETEDQAAVRELIERIAESLGRVTINLERWADKPIAECAARIWEAEFGADPAWVSRVARLEVTTRLLAHVRAEGSGRSDDLIAEVGTHARRLARLRLRPADLGAEVTLRRGARWAVVRLPLVAVPATITAVASYLLFWIPFRVTGQIVDAFRADEDQRSTYKLLVGIATYSLWVIGVAVAAAFVTHPALAIALLLLLPLAGMVGLTIRERWRGSWGDVRRFFLMRSRRALVQALRDRQTELARRMKALYEETLGKGETP